MLAGLLVLPMVLTQAPAQNEKNDKPKMPPMMEEPGDSNDPADILRRLSPPKTVGDFWEHLQEAINLGSYPLAAKYLHALLEKKPTEEELISLWKREKGGMTAFTRLRTRPVEWANQLNVGVNENAAQVAAQVDALARKDTEILIDQMTRAVNNYLGDEKKILYWVTRLKGLPEERNFALPQLFQFGSRACPVLERELRSAGTDKIFILWALARLGKEIVLPMAAALDNPDPLVQLDLIAMFRQRGAVEAVPYLWPLTESPNREVRRKATETVAYLLNVKEDKLPQAKLALTREAERYHYHKVPLGNVESVPVWTWDPERGLVETRVSASKAEEYYGLRWARLALALDPTYQPAQVVLLSVALDKAMERGGLSLPLLRTSPQAHQLVASSNPDLVIAVLERALGEQRIAVAVAAARALGDIGAILATRPGGRGEPVLVKALNFPDRRVQFAAAESILRIPGPPAGQAVTRLVDVLRRALAGDPGAKSVPRVLIGYFDQDFAGRVVEAVQRAGYDPVKVRTGREVLRRLNEAADIDLLLLDADLPNPGLMPLLAQLRADRNAAMLPVILTVTGNRDEQIRRLVSRYPYIEVYPSALVLDAIDLNNAFQGKLVSRSTPPLTPEELQEYAEKAIFNLARLARGDPPGYDVRPALDAVYSALRSGKLMPQGEIGAAIVLGNLAGGRPQVELASLISDARRQINVRLAACQELVRHIQKHGLVLNQTQIDGLTRLYAQPMLDPNLKANLSQVLGSMKPDARLTGDRLIRYDPGLAPPPKKEPPPPPMGDKPPMGEKDPPKNP